MITKPYSKLLTGRLYGYFTNTLGMHDYRNGWLKGDCPFCGKNQKFGINLSRKKANCFVCGDHGNPVKAIMTINGFIDIQEFYKFIEIFEEVEYNPKIEKVERNILNPELPEGFRFINEGTSQIARSARQYMRSRGFSIKYLTRHSIGYCVTGEYFGYIIIPYHTRGELSYFNGRRFIGFGPRYKNPKAESFGVGKSLIMYNSEALWLYRTVYLMEGALNALTLGDKSVASMGNRLSAYQLSVIIKSPVENIVILYDPDAIQNSIAMALQLIPHKKVKVVVLPNDRDVNKLGKKATMQVIRETGWDTWNSLIARKNNKSLIRQLERAHLYG